MKRTKTNHNPGAPGAVAQGAEGGSPTARQGRRAAGREMGEGRKGGLRCK